MNLNLTAFLLALAAMSQVLDAQGLPGTPGTPGTPSTPTGATVSGTIRTPEGQPVPGVTVVFSGSGSVTTDSSGRYIMQLTSGYSGTATPSLAGKVFVPASRAYSNLRGNSSGEDYTASLTITSYGVSGIVRTATGQLLAGVSVSFSDGPTVSTNAAGNYSVSLPAGYSGTAFASLAGYTFLPASRSYTRLGQNFGAENYTATADPIQLTVSGVIRSTNGDPSGGVLIRFSGGLMIVTDPSGGYSIQVPTGYTGRAIPESPGLSFTPAFRSYDSLNASVAAQDYTATPSSPSISGMIRTSTGQPLVGAAVVFTGGPSALTDGSGNYSIKVPVGYSGTASASLSGYAFSPRSRAYNAVNNSITGQDYTATPSDIIVSGTIRTGTGQPLPGASVRFTDGPTTLADAAGRYSLTVSPGYSGTASVLLAGYAFTPPSRFYSTLSESINGQDYVGLQSDVGISGTVRASGGQVLAGASIAFTGGRSAITSASGSYAVTVPAGYSGTAIATLQGFTFSPASRRYDGVVSTIGGQDYVGTPQAVTISGAVRSSAGQPLPAVSVVFTDGPSTTTDASGRYSVSVPSGYSGTASPTLPGYTFSPPSRAFSVITASLTEQDFVGSGTAACVRPRIPEPNPDIDIQGLHTSDTLDANHPCAAPRIATHFLSTAANVHVWFLAKGASEGDAVVLEWHSPGGHLYRETAIQAVNSVGSSCYSASLAISGTRAAALVGLWQVRLVWNGVPAASTTFSVSPVPSPNQSSIMIDSLLTTRDVPAGCASPDSVTLFLPPDVQQQTWVLFRTPDSGRMEFRYYAPDGQVHKRFRGDSYASKGRQCMWSTLTLSAEETATMSGDWKVALFFNDLQVSSVAFRLVPAVLDLAYTSASSPPKGSACSARPEIRGFRHTEASAYVWFLVRSGRTGDQASVEWHQPDGRLFRRDRWRALDDDGDWCFSTSLGIAADLPATLPGIWSANILWNGTPLGSVPFVIGGVTVEQWILSNARSGCQAPPSTDLIDESEREAVVWLRLRDAELGAVADIEWIAPNGATAQTRQWRAPQAGSHVITDALPIATSTPRASGQWLARVRWNGTALLEIPFVLRGSQAGPSRSDVHDPRVDRVAREAEAVSRPVSHGVNRTMRTAALLSVPPARVRAAEAPLFVDRF